MDRGMLTSSLPCVAPSSPRLASPPPPSIFRCLHELDELFSKLVEAVSEVGKKEEEYRVVENETDKLLRRQGGSTRLEVG